MRKISTNIIILFSLLMGATALAAWTLATLIAKVIGSGQTTYVIGALTLSGFVLASAFEYRLIQRRFPIAHGDIALGSRDERVFHLLSLYAITVFHPMTSSGIVLPPFSRQSHRLLGSRIGANSYPGDGRLDYPHALLTIGDNVIFGNGSHLTPHVFESGRIVVAPIVIGDNVTIGMRAVIFPGVSVGDNSIVAAGAVVAKHTVIPPNEIWSGIPAQKIRDR